MKPIAIFGSVVFLVSAAEAATPDPGSAAALRPRVLVAAPLTGEAPTIDGRLDEAAWKEAQTATDFVQRRPNPGDLATLRTEARVLYDSDSLYVGIRAYDPEPSAILAPWPRRDDETTSDWLFVELDSRHDRRTAFSFGVNPRGVQVDGTFAKDVEFDTAWDGVWESGAQIDAEGWTAEFRIPFSQLPYTATGSSEGGSSIWGINFYRHNPHLGETSNWSPRLPSLAGIVSNFNELHLRVPRNPRRLELVPYVSASVNRVPLANPLAETEGVAGGLDVKMGLGSAFAVSAAIHPDFSQVEADPSEVNLTTFETFFSERRPVFVESAGFFRFDTSLPFTSRDHYFGRDETIYSRRIGRAPRLSLPDGVLYGHAPEVSTLIGAAKLTGRTSNGWSVGTLAATTGIARGEYVDESGLPGSLFLEPRTHFAAARVSRDFRRGRSALGAFATIVARPGMDAHLASVLSRDAEAAGVDGRHRFAGDDYELTGFAVGSHVSETTEASGFGGQLRLAKVGGEHWRWSVAAHSLSPNLELNDLGFQRDSDWLLALGTLSYQEDRPGRVFRRWQLGSKQVGGGWSFGGERRAAVANADFSFDLNNYWGGGVSFYRELPVLDTVVLRGGPALLLPPRNALTVSLYTDQRSASQGTLDVQAYRDRESDGRGTWLSAGATVRPIDRLAFSFGPTYESKVNPWQFVASRAGVPIVGRLEQTSMALTVRMDLAFSSKLTLQLYAQPFASRGSYSDYREVVAPRAERLPERFAPLAPELLPDSAPPPSFSVTDLRMNVVLRWEYRPGSRLYVVWGQA
ncbi:MAG TPA: DUF5916 domain-containing protein, partial [Vicinamibacteria bacterium]